MKTQIKINHLSKTFNTLAGPKKALDDVSLEIAEGECVVIGGENGSGKSVLMQIIAGLMDGDKSPETVVSIQPLRGHSTTVEEGVRVYTIGQIEDLTGVKAHVLRYWEEVVPGFTPRKDMAGRRLYSQREVDLILRLKYLINEKKFTAEGAGRQIIEEAQAVQDNADLINQIRECRQLLTETYLKVKKNNDEQ